MLIATETAIVSRIISVWQWWASRKGTRNAALFDRRIEIYEKLAAFLANTLQAGRVAPGAEAQFLRDTKRAYFVFGGNAKIRTLISETYRRAIDLQALTSEENGLPVGDARKGNIQAQRVIKEQFETTLQSLEKTFKDYLSLA